MVRSRDFAQAQADVRRRLAAAFHTGATGRWSGRRGVVVAGVVLAAIVLGGGAIAGRVLDRPPTDWRDAGSVVIARDSGQLYVVSGDDGVLHRVPNPVSARLVVGANGRKPVVVDDTAIDEVVVGDDLGIPGAPTVVPDSDRLRSEWTACSARGSGVLLSLGARSSAPVREGAVLVTTGGRLWLIVSGNGAARRHEIRGGLTQAATLAGRLGFSGRSDAVPVDRRWLRLVPVGSPVAADAFDVRRLGAPALYPGRGTDLSAYRIGDLLRTPAGSVYLLGDDGPERLMSPFAIAVWSALRGDPVDVDAEISFDYAPPSHPADWPRAVPPQMSAGPLCARLETSGGKKPRVALTAGWGDQVASGVAEGEVVIDVPPDAGAFIAGSAGQAAQLVTSAGVRHALVGSDAVTSLGLDGVEPVPVPAEWWGLIDEGAILSVTAARSPR